MEKRRKERKGEKAGIYAVFAHKCAFSVFSVAAATTDLERRAH